MDEYRGHFSSVEYIFMIMGHFSERKEKRKEKKKRSIIRESNVRTGCTYALFKTDAEVAMKSFTDDFFFSIINVHLVTFLNGSHQDVKRAGRRRDGRVQLLTRFKLPRVQDEDNCKNGRRDGFLGSLRFIFYTRYFQIRHLSKLYPPLCRRIRSMYSPQGLKMNAKNDAPPLYIHPRCTRVRTMYTDIKGWY